MMYMAECCDAVEGFDSLEKSRQEKRRLLIISTHQQAVLQT